MFPEEWTTLDTLLWVNVKALAAHPVVIGIMVIIIALEFTPFLVKAMLALTGRSKVLGPRTAADMMARKRGEGGLWADHEDSMDFDEDYRREYSNWRFGRYMKRTEGYYDESEWHDSPY